MPNIAVSASVVAAALSLCSAITVAMIGSISARRARTDDARFQRLLDAENRNAETKFRTYEPILELFQLLLTPAQAQEKFLTMGDTEIENRLDEFGKWIVIYGSTEAVEAYHDFKVSFFSLEPGESKEYYWNFLPLLYRLYANFVIAVRHDIGFVRDDKDIQARHVLALGAVSLYKSHLADASRMPMNKLYTFYRRQYGWTRPWTTKPSETSPLSPGRPAESPGIDASRAEERLQQSLRLIEQAISDAADSAEHAKREDGAKPPASDS